MPAGAKLFNRVLVNTYDHLAQDVSKATQVTPIALRRGDVKANGNGNVISAIKNSEMNKNVASWLLQEPGAAAGKGRTTYDNINTAYGMMRGAMGKGISHYDTQIKSMEAAIKAGGVDADELGNMQQVLGQYRRDRAGLQGRRAMSYVGQAGAYGKRFAQWSFAEGTTRDRFVKGGIAVGGYMGANMVGRGITGGGLTYNNDGERDIAGLPFL